MTHHDKARELVELVRAALTFCNAAAGEGLEIDGLSPEDFLMSYSGTTGFEDWDRIGDHAADAITALAEENRRLREALKKIASTGRCEFAEVRAVLRSTEASHD